MIPITKKTFMISLVFLILVSFVIADTLVLKDGRVLQGTYKGGDETSVFFEVEGKEQAIPLFDITTITFSPREETAEVGSAAQAGSVTIPAGSRVLVKLTQPVSTASHKEGASVTGVLATGLAANGQIVVPPGTKIHGKVLESRKRGRC